MSPNDLPKYNPSGQYVSHDPRAYAGWVMAYAIVSGLGGVASALHNIADAIRESKSDDGRTKAHK